MSLCTCAFRPACESNRSCEDATGTLWRTDLRTGTVRAAADWTIMLGAWGRSPFPRVVFYCDNCLKALDEAAKKPIPGIDRPPHASDFWQPSFTAMIDHALRADRERIRQLTPHRVTSSSTARLDHLSPAQREQLAFLRKMSR